MKTLFRQLLSLLLFSLLASSASAAPRSRPQPVAEVRVLFLVDSSLPMVEFKDAIGETVSAQILSGLDGQLNPGDLFVVWPFAEKAWTDRYLPVSWHPRTKQLLAERTGHSLRNQLYAGTAHLDQAMTEAWKLVLRSEKLTVLILSTAANPISKTAFDDKINALYQEVHSNRETRGQLLVTTLQAEHGRIVRWAVQSLNWPRTNSTETMAAPANVPVAAAPAPTVAPKPIAAASKPAPAPRTNDVPALTYRPTLVDRELQLSTRLSFSEGHPDEPLAPEPRTSTPAPTAPDPQPASVSARPAEPEPVNPPTPPLLQKPVTSAAQPSAPDRPVVVQALTPVPSPEPPPTQDVPSAVGPATVEAPATAVLGQALDQALSTAPTNAAALPAASEVQAPQRLPLAPVTTAPPSAREASPVSTSASVGGGVWESPATYLMLGVGLAALAALVLWQVFRTGKTEQEPSFISRSLDARK